MRWGVTGAKTVDNRGVVAYCVQGLVDHLDVEALERLGKLKSMT
jgi:hypothetical protein